MVMSITVRVLACLLPWLTLISCATGQPNFAHTLSMSKYATLLSRDFERRVARNERVPHQESTIIDTKFVSAGIACIYPYSGTDRYLLRQGRRVLYRTHNPTVPLYFSGPQGVASGTNCFSLETNQKLEIFAVNGLVLRQVTLHPIEKIDAKLLPKRLQKGRGR